MSEVSGLAETIKGASDLRAATLVDLSGASISGIDEIRGTALRNRIVLTCVAVGQPDNTLGGDDTVALQTAPRGINVPQDTGLAMANAGLRVAFDAAAPSRRKEMVRLVADAKTPETRERRIQKVLSDLGS